MLPVLDLRPLVLALAPFAVDALVPGDPAPARPTPTSSSSSAEIATKLADQLERSYVFEDKGRAMAAALRAKAASGAWKDVEGRALADALTDTCRAVADDKHLRVRHEGEGAPRPQSPFLAEGSAAQRHWAQRNHGFERAERLQGNVGYLDVRSFAPHESSKAAATAAMAFVQDTDALVIDLRKNGGGQPESVRYLCSYFFGEEPVLLNVLVNRELGTREEFWTLRDLPGKRYGDKPVFVLVGKDTFSGAEEFAYDLQTRGRATVVGMTSGGGAHPVDRRALGGGYSVMLPIARAENPVTKTNWESVGVVPTVEVDEEGALERAWGLALEHLASQEKDAMRKKHLEELAAEKLGKTAR